MILNMFFKISDHILITLFTMLFMFSWNSHFNLDFTYKKINYILKLEFHEFHLI